MFFTSWTAFLARQTFLIDGGIKILVRTLSFVNSLRMPDKQVAAGYCGLEEALYQRFLCGTIKIDHNIPAENKIEFSFEMDGFH